MADDDDFAAQLSAFEQEQPGAARAEPAVGDKVRGKVVSIGTEYVLVDLGVKAEAAMEVTDLHDAEGNLTVALGDTVEAAVTRKDERFGLLILGSEHGHRVHGHDELESAFRDQAPVEGLVTGITKGGAEVQIAGVRGFCPASQMDLRYIEDLETFVGQRLSFRITRFEGGRRANVVVSRRVLLEEEQQALAAQTRAQLQEGAVLAGTVISLKDFGAFVDLGGVEGMVHISELAFERVKHPSDVLGVGQQVEVAVLRIEHTDNPRHPEKIALSIRALAKDPWDEAGQKFPAGTAVRGTVTRLQPFGAFVELAPGIEGLVHVSALGVGRRVSHPHEVVNIGDEIQAVVLSVDPAKRRIALSMETDQQPEIPTEEIRAYTAPEQPDGKVGTLGKLLQESMKKQKPPG
jgi:small subunit ribosomal protein S1